jgi:hypothetical protein
VTLPPHDWHAPIVAAVVAAYARHRAPVYVEIGVDRGHTMRVVSPNTIEAHAVDVTFEHVHGPLGPNVHRWPMTSAEFFESTRSWLEADVVFVDGDHSAEAVNEDIANALTVLKRDGTIVVHDTFPTERRWAASHCGDGYRVIEELRGDRELDVATLPVFPGLTFITYRQAAVAA